jgi:serine/threonine-protein kinase
MSPEQLDGRTAEVDVRTDVYALGVILYELLAGRRPFDDEHLGSSGLRDEPPLPSGRGERRELRGDLDNICLMAIRPEAERRYRSAADLADDLARHREGRPVQASPDSWRYRAGKASRRHPVLITMSLAALVFVVAGVGFLAFHARRLDAERDRALAAEVSARQEADAAAEIAAFLEGMFVDMDPLEECPAPTTALALLDKGAARLAGDLGDQPLNRGRLWAVMGRVNQSISRNQIAIEQVHLSLAAYAELADSNAVAGARAEAYETLASALHDLGRYAASEGASRHALALHRDTGPPADVARLRLTSALATAIQAQGRLGEAQDMFQQAIELAGQLGEAGADEAAYMQTMRGYILYKRGFYHEALTDLTSALALNRRLHPGDNMDLVSALNNVGGMHRELGHYDEAEALILESEDMLNRIYQGGDHPAIYRAISHLAGIALARGDTASAAAALENAHVKTVALLGPDNPSSWRTRDNLALAQHLRGHDDEARQTYQASLANWEGQVGPHNSRTLSCRQGYGRFLLDTGDLAAARQVLQAAIDGYVADYEPGHPQLCATQVDLAEVRLREGDKAGARVLLQEAVPLLEEVFGEDFALCRRARGLLQRTS